jgi:hypothetical protein
MSSPAQPIYGAWGCAPQCTTNPCETTPCGTATADMQTAPANTTLGQSQDAQGGGSGSVSQWTTALSNLGISVASAVTGRPVVTTNVNGQRIATLGNKPLVTGQVQTSTVLFVGALVAVAIAWMVLAKER